MAPGLISGDAHAVVVQRFYDAVAARDGDAIAAVVDAHIAEEASIEWPPSLPYGGRVQGARRLRRMFLAMAASEASSGPGPVKVLSLTASGDTVAAQLGFEWFPPGGGAGVSSGALELWTFDGDKAVEIRAYYWDTAALVAAAAEEKS